MKVLSCVEYLSIYTVIFSHYVNSVKNYVSINFVITCKIEKYIKANFLDSSKPYIVFLGKVTKLRKARNFVSQKNVCY